MKLKILISWDHDCYLPQTGDQIKLHMEPQAVLGQRLVSMQVSPASGVYPVSQ